MKKSKTASVLINKIGSSSILVECRFTKPDNYRDSKFSKPIINWRIHDNSAIASLHALAIIRIY